MRIMILYASAGSGHKRAAEALAAAFSPEHETAIRDILEFTPKIFRETYASGYLRIVRKAPELWGYMYTHADRTARIRWRRKVRSTFNQINALTFFKFYDRFKPDAVICTHFMPLEILSARHERGKAREPLFCTVTDFAVHSLWEVENVDCYYLATDEAARHMLRRGQPADRVKVTGIPIDPVFESSTPPATARKRLGLKNMPTILILSGGFGVGPTVDLIKSFTHVETPCQLVVVAGANSELKTSSVKAAAALPIPAVVQGFVTNIHELMDAADIVVSKPGGLTSSEVMAKGKPLIIVDPIPGQEQRNCEYLLESGAALRLFETEDISHKVTALLSDSGKMAHVRASAREIGKPDAAHRIAANVIERTGYSTETN